MTRPLTAPGRLVAGRYRLESQIGGGGMGAVWLARDELLGRQVAIKQVLSAPGVTPEQTDQQRQRAMREGRIAARLSHPHAISVYDVALEGDQPWLVMEYLPSRSLAAVLNEDGVLRTDQVAQIGAQVADALSATHAAGIVHRDVKPANILIGEGGRVEGLVKITDFGISHASGDVTLTQTGQITGTPAFLAPEVAQGQPMTEASDVFSLGATLYTCLEGSPPFGMEDNALGMLHRVAGGAIVPPRRAGSLTEPLLKMLAADPADRPTMAEIRDDLAKAAAGRDGDTTTILMARTDLRSNAPGRVRTTAFPADAAAAAATSAPTPLPPPPVRPAPVATVASPPTPSPSPVPSPASSNGNSGGVVPRPAPPAEPPVQRSRRGLWLLAGLAVLVLAALGVFWVLGMDDKGGGNGTSAAGTTSASTPPSAQSSESAPATQSESSEATTESSTSETSAPAAGGDPAAAVTAFFADVPGDLKSAYAQTSPGFQSAHPYGNFSGFWSRFSAVRIGNVVNESDTAALLDITYVEQDGSSQTERHRISFVPGDGGRLQLDNDDNSP